MIHFEIARKSDDTLWSRLTTLLCISNEPFWRNKPYFSAGTDRRKSNLSGPWTLHTRGLILSLKSCLYQQMVISFLPSIIPYWLWFYCDWWWATSHSICSHHFLLAHTSPHPPTYLHPQLWMNASKPMLRIFYIQLEQPNQQRTFYMKTVWTAHSSFKNLYF